MKEEHNFLGRFCTLEFHSGFVLDGKVTEENEFGITFKTTQKTSFISWDAIKRLTPKDGDY